MKQKEDQDIICSIGNLTESLRMIKFWRTQQWHKGREVQYRIEVYMEGTNAVERSKVAVVKTENTLTALRAEERLKIRHINQT